MAPALWLNILISIMNGRNRNGHLLSTVEQLLTNIIDNGRGAVTPLSHIREVGFVAISVALLIELGLDKHARRPFFNAEFNLNYARQVVTLIVQKNDLPQ